MPCVVANHRRGLAVQEEKLGEYCHSAVPSFRSHMEQTQSPQRMYTTDSKHGGTEGKAHRKAPLTYAGIQDMCRKVHKLRLQTHLSAIVSVNIFQLGLRISPLVHPAGLALYAIRETT